MQALASRRHCGRSKSADTGLSRERIGSGRRPAVDCGNRANLDEA